MRNVHFENCKAVELPPIDPPLYNGPTITPCYHPMPMAKLHWPLYKFACKRHGYIVYLPNSNETPYAFKKWNHIRFENTPRCICRGVYNGPPLRPAVRHQQWRVWQLPSLCLCVCICHCERSHSWTVWQTNPRFGCGIDPNDISVVLEVKVKSLKSRSPDWD